SSSLLPLYNSTFYDTIKNGSYTLSLHDALPILEKILIVLLIGVLAWAVSYQPSYREGETLEQVQAIFAEAKAREQARRQAYVDRSEEHTSELQSRENIVCRLLLEKKNKIPNILG